jgi:hypothetical protein
MHPKVRLNRLKNLPHEPASAYLLLRRSGAIFRERGFFATALG